MSKIVCISGMCGAGKSVVSDFFVKNGFQYIRFGQLTIEELKKRNLEVNETNERTVREDLRKTYGMAAYAILNLPKFDQLMKTGNVIADGLYSWEEYKILKNHYNDDLVVVAVYASPKIRYERLEKRNIDGGVDFRNRPLTREDAKSRDYSELEKLNKGGPIAMADFTIVNDKDINFLNQQIEEIYGQIK
ncbi:MAG: AAA family ATPase [Candidatus Shapirobacteria bacterium]|jgi:dephospho-CoA kinase|nr:AAA family ATPase [Candidatus Shapirobacteria bacterium]